MKTFGLYRRRLFTSILTVELVNDKIHMSIKNTDQGGLYIYKGQNIGVVDLRYTRYNHSTRDSIKDV